MPTSLELIDWHLGEGLNPKDQAVCYLIQRLSFLYHYDIIHMMLLEGNINLDSQIITLLSL